MGDITELLQRWHNGDPAALNELTNQVYQELRRMAAHYLRTERPNHTMQATALVHEVYLRLDAMQEFDWHTRAQFFSMVATLMRNILVDHARKRNAQKRALPLDPPSGGDLATDVDVLAVHLALDKMQAQFPREARVVELRFFGGLDGAEAARVLEVSLSTVERQWRFARAWLRNEIARKN